MVRSLDVDNSTLTCREREYYLYIMTERKRQFNMDSRGEGESVVSKKEIGDAWRASFKSERQWRFRF